MKRLDSTIDTGNLDGRATVREDGRKEGRSASRRPRRKKAARSSNSYLSPGRSLGSERDRQRLQDRNAAERRRVERMLAEAPSPTKMPSSWSSSRSSGSPALPSRSGPARLRALPTASAWACPVCASGKVVRDEVAHAGTLRLSECLHCDHRWTERTRGRWSELGDRISGRERRPPKAIAEAGFVRPVPTAH